MTRCLVVLFALLLSVPNIARAEVARLDAGQRAKVATAMQALLERQRANADMPSLAVAVFDRDGIIWSSAVGYVDKARKRAATPDAIYRAGSISKLFTDIMIMQEVATGRLSLDAPITQYLPDFTPTNPFSKPITLRSLMAHRSGLIREPSVGSYFDDVSPPVADVIAALNKTTLVAEPGTFEKYSNGAVQLLGYILERETGKTYDQLVAERIFQPTGMRTSGFSVKPFKGRIAFAQFTPYGQPRLDAPLFDLGVDAAGGLNTNVLDLSRFGMMILNGGRGSNGQVIGDADLKAMMKLQYADPGQKRGFGLGFQVAQIDDALKVGHGGAIYGYTADLQMLPELGVGVVAMGTIDLAAEPFVLSNFALRFAKALIEAKTPPTPEAALTALTAEQKTKLAGWYLGGEGSLAVRIVDGRALLEAPRLTGEIRALDGKPMLYSDIGFSGEASFDPDGGWIKIDGIRYARAERCRPPDADPALVPLIGYYKKGTNELSIYERDGKPYINIEWTAYEPMRQTGDNELTFLDDSLLYPREKLTFIRDAQGAVTAASLGGIIFNRVDPGAVLDRTKRAPNAAAFDTWRAAARRATPPKEKGEFLKPDLVDLTTLGDGLQFDIRYATTENFVGVPVYRKPVAMLQRPAAIALLKAQRALHASGLGITVQDGYRPWYVTKFFWEATPPDQRIFVADPKEGSRHNRGAAVDIGMYDVQSGAPLSSTGLYDEVTPRSYVTYVGGTSLQRWRRDALVAAMTDAGFDVYLYEWWHFDYRDWRRYPILNIDAGQ